MWNYDMLKATPVMLPISCLSRLEWLDRGCLALGKSWWWV